MIALGEQGRGGVPAKMVFKGGGKKCISTHAKSLEIW